MTAQTPAAPTSATNENWWRDAVIYQIYIRSFADGDGDGIGDLAGIRSKLPYLLDLGVDAVWITPWYPSPMADGGYDVADYRDIEKLFGDLDQADAFISEAHAHGIRVILDVVPNHTSDAHAWFVAARAKGIGAPERDLYWFRPAKADGSPPNNWPSMFGGPAWKQLPEDVAALAAAGESQHADYYLHLFAPEQPDLNWDNEEVHDDLEATLRFWFDKGVDGFRIDVAHGMVKDPSLPDLADNDESHLLNADTTHDHPFWDQPGVHDIYRRWRKVADSYENSEQGKRVFVAEAWVRDPERLAHYVRPDELHTTFNFAFLSCAWNADAFRDVVDEQIETLDVVGAPVTWVVSNHDVIRHRTRYGRAIADARKPAGTVPTDLELGLARARAMVLFMLALPGSVYIYQGEELGLPEVEDLPEEVLADPTWIRTNHQHRGRDGCRVPIPWTPDGSSLGFGPDGSTPWLPQPESFGKLSVEAQSTDPSSTLQLYKDALAIRRERPELGDGPMDWLANDDNHVLEFSRSDEFVCVVNLGSTAATLPPHRTVLLASGDVTGDVLPGNSAAWLEI